MNIDWWKEIVWRQFGAAIDMLENAIAACPEDAWSRPSHQPEFWYAAYHTLFFLDFYLSESEVGFAPPEPFTLSELDPRGAMPERVYTKAELLAYLEHGRSKCRAAIASLTGEGMSQRCGFEQRDFSLAELLLYTMRHVQHHAGQLNLMLRQAMNAAPRWVSRTGTAVE